MLDDVIAELDRAVHQVMEVRRGERQRIVVSDRAGSTTRHLRPGGCSKRTRAGRLSNPRAHISVAGMFRCACVASTLEIGAVDAIAKDAVGDDDRAVVTGHVPLVQIGTRGRERRALAVAHRDVEHVLRELVQRIASRRRAAHADLQRPGRNLGEGHLDLHPAMLGRRKRQAIIDRRLRERRRDAE